MDLFDAHVHSAPCVFPRLGSDAQIVSMYRASGFAGCVLKGHASPTTARAAAARLTAGLEVYGGVVLNRAVGGIAPEVVREELALGARVVWMPTLDATAHRLAGLPLPADHHAEAIPMPPDDPRHEDALLEIFSSIAEADAVLATGHLSNAQCRWLVASARTAGVRRVVLTHPTFTVPNMTPDEVIELTRLGAVCEITAYQLSHGSSASSLARLAAELGPESCVLTSDAGQPDALSPPDALVRLVQCLVRAGLDAQAATSMASERPYELIAP